MLAHEEGGRVRTGIVTLAAAAVALLASLVAVSSTQPMGALGALVVRLDLAAPLLVAVSTFVLALVLEGSAARARVPRLLAGMWAAWLMALTFIVAIGDVRPSIERLVLMAVTMRPWAPGFPQTAAGSLLLTAAVVTVCLPFAARALRSGTGLLHRLRLPAALIVVGWVVRLALIAAEATAPHGLLGTVPGHLDQIGLGLAAYVLVRHARSTDHAAPDDDTGTLAIGKRRRPAVLGAVAIGLLTLGAAAWWLGLPEHGAPVTGGDLVVHALCALVLSASVLATLMLATPASPATRTATRITALAAIVGPGVLLVSPAAFVSIALRYPERAVVSGGTVELAGAALPLWIWSLVIGAAFGVLIAVVLVTGRWLLGGRRPAELPTAPLAVASVTSVGFFIRLWVLFSVAPPGVDGGDPLFYHVTANLLAHGRGFAEPLTWLSTQTFRPSALHGPLYPFVLSISSRFGGITYFDHQMASTLIGSAVVLATVLLGRQIGGRAVGLVAGLLAAFYPNLWLIDSLLFPEGLMALLTTLAALAAYRWRDAPRLRTAALTGALIGLAALTRGEGLLLAPFILVPWTLTTWSLERRRRLQHLAVSVAAMIAVIAPWTVRNLLSFEHVVPLSTNGNELIVYANCETTYSGRLIGYWDFGCQQRIRGVQGDPPGDESERAQYWRSVGLDYAKDNLDQVPKVLAVRALRQWELFRPMQNFRLSGIEGRVGWGGFTGLLMFYGLAALSVVGVISLRRRRQPILPIAAQFLAVTVTAVYAYGTVRFRAPAEPALCVLAAAGLVPLARRAKRWLESDDPDPQPSGAFVEGGNRGLRLRIDGAWNRGAVRTWGALAAVAAVAALPLRGLYRTTGPTMEEGFMLVFPERLLAGDLPNRDFLHLYGPGAIDLLAVWFGLLRFDIGTERTFGLLQIAAVVLALFTLARPWGRLMAWGIASSSVFYVLITNGLTAMAWNGGLALALWSIVCGVRARNTAQEAGSTTSGARWIVAAGVLAGAALTFRPDLAIAVAVTHAWLLWRRPGVRRFVIGAAVGLLPMWVHLVMVGPAKAVDGMVIDPVFRLRPGRRLPIPPSPHEIQGALQAIGEQAAPWWRLPALTAPQSLFVWFFVAVAAPIVALLVSRALHRRASSPGTVVLMAGSIFSLGILPQALQRPDSTHLSWVSCVSFVMLTLVLAEVLRRRRPTLRPARHSAIALSALTLLTFVVAPLYTYRYYVYFSRMSIGQIASPFSVERDGRWFRLGDPRSYRASTELIAELDRLSSPGERLLVGPADLRRTWYNDAFFYHLFPELPPATYYIEMDPGLADAPGSRLADDVASADWLILSRIWDGWLEPNASMDFGSDEPNQVVRDRFCLVGSFEDGLMELWRRCRP
jgi:4-amino-4-deoxy-L-arabinose transferase-like glycosyltransferase